MNILTNTIVSITLCLLTIGAYHFQFARDTPEIITVDVNQLIEEKIRTLTSNGQDESYNKKAIHTFGQKLERTIEKISEKKHLIVLPSQAVIAGAPDYTNAIRKGVNQ